jgi:hypothetical protein
MRTTVRSSQDERRSAWFDATAVFGLAVAVLRLARDAQPFVADTAMLVRTGESTASTPTSWVRVALASMLVVALLRRWSVVTTAASCC